MNESQITYKSQSFYVPFIFSQFRQSVMIAPTGLQESRRSDQDPGICPYRVAQSPEYFYYTPGNEWTSTTYQTKVEGWAYSFIKKVYEDACTKRSESCASGVKKKTSDFSAYFFECDVDQCWYEQAPLYIRNLRSCNSNGCCPKRCATCKRWISFDPANPRVNENPGMTRGDFYYTFAFNILYSPSLNVVHRTLAEETLLRTWAQAVSDSSTRGGGDGVNPRTVPDCAYSKTKSLIDWAAQGDWGTDLVCRAEYSHYQDKTSWYSFAPKRISLALYTEVAGGPGDPYPTKFVQAATMELLTDLVVPQFIPQTHSKCPGFEEASMIAGVVAGTKDYAVAKFLNVAGSLIDGLGMAMSVASFICSST